MTEITVSFPQDPEDKLKSSDDVLVLSPVSRRDSGIYQCRPPQADSQADVKGEMQLTVHCEEPSLSRAQTVLSNVSHMS